MPKENLKAELTRTIIEPFVLQSQIIKIPTFKTSNPFFNPTRSQIIKNKKK